ncbi:MAG: hypothetical protein RXO36_05815 [Candidatus Nanopusillus acidilobi]|jgi:hypothetical protein
MAKKVRVRPYEKQNGTRVRGYVREDPRAKEHEEQELPPEEQKPSFLAEDIEKEDEETDKEEDNSV